MLIHIEGVFGTSFERIEASIAELSIKLSVYILPKSYVMLCREFQRALGNTVILWVISTDEGYKTIEHVIDHYVISIMIGQCAWFAHRKPWLWLATQAN